MSLQTDVATLPTPLVVSATRELLERNARLIALLDSFENRDAEAQRQELDALEVAIEEDRPGQRRIFGAGLNP